MAIKIDFLSNTRSVTKDIEQVGDELEKVSGSLDDVARDAQRSGDKVGEAYTDAAKEGERAADRLERSFKDASDETAKATKRGADDMARNTSEGTSRAKADLEELGNEARQNAAETFSSFDGSAASFADGIQGTLGGIVSSLGPIGAAAGAAGAIGIGLILSSIDKTAERTQALRERTAELAQEYIDTGQVGEASLEFIVDKLKELATETDESATSLADLKDISDKAGSSYADLAKAYSGNSQGIDELLDKNRRLLDATKAQLDADQEGLAQRDRAYSSNQTQGLERYIGYLEEAQTAAADAAEQQRLYVEAGGPEMERKAELIEAINDAYDEGAGNVDDYINAESGLFDTAAYIAAMTEKQQALTDYENTLASTSLTPEARDYITSQGIESAATFLAGYKTATPAQQAELNRIWSEAGRTSSGSFSESVKAKLADAGFNSSVLFVPDMSEVDSAIERRKKQVIQIGINAAILPSNTRVP